MIYYGPYSDNLSTFTLLKQIAQIPQNLLLARVKRVRGGHHCDYDCKIIDLKFKARFKVRSWCAPVHS